MFLHTQPSGKGEHSSFDFMQRIIFFASLKTVECNARRKDTLGLRNKWSRSTDLHCFDWPVNRYCPTESDLEKEKGPRSHFLSLMSVADLHASWHCWDSADGSSNPHRIFLCPTLANLYCRRQLAWGLPAIIAATLQLEHSSESEVQLRYGSCLGGFALLPRSASFGQRIIYTSQPSDRALT